MKQTRKSSWLLAAAVAAAVPFVAAAPADAQYQTNTGHALDANNQVGAAGQNGGVIRSAPVTGNQIANGNATRGAYFRGPSAIGDAREFRAATVGSFTDRFISDSSGAATRAQPTLQGFTPQAYYGTSRGVAPPPGFVPLSYTGGYVPGGAAPDSFNLARQGGQAALATYGSAFTGDRATLSTRVVPGTGDDAGRENLFELNPLSGIQQIPNGDLSAANGQTGMLVSRTSTFVRPDQQTDRFRTDAKTIEQMRKELEAANPADVGGGNPSAAPGTPASPAAGAGATPLNNTLRQGYEAPTNGALDRHEITSGVQQAPLSTSVQTNETLRQTLPGAERQTPVYNELRDRLKRYDQNGQPPAEAENAEFQRARAARDKAAAGTKAPTDDSTTGAPAPGGPRIPGTVLPGAVQPGKTVPAGAPGAAGSQRLVPNVRLSGGGPTGPAPSPTGGAGGGGAVARPATTPPTPQTVLPSALPRTPAASPGAARPAPLVVSSLATGVRAQALGGVLKQAEDLMKQGKFASALDRYDVAEEGAPNNPLIALGKAHAELGASSYRSADAHIRQAFEKDRALLMARYDLNAFIGAERVQTLTTDLTGLAKSNPQDPMPPFLLAYISYNAGDAAHTPGHLAEVERREGRADPVIQQMRQLWTLPAAGAAAPATASPNK